MLGFLEKLPRGDPIPKECLNCRRLVECAMAKRAFDWYRGKIRLKTPKTEETIGQKCRSTLKNKKRKVRHGIDSIGNVRVRRYTGLICAQPSPTILKIGFSNMCMCIKHLGFLVRKDKKHQILASLHK
jgi:hypothetical protein